VMNLALQMLCDELEVTFSLLCGDCLCDKLEVIFLNSSLW